MVVLFLIPYFKVLKSLLAATKNRQKHITYFRTILQSLLGIQTAQAYEYVFFKPAEGVSSTMTKVEIVKDIHLEM